MFITYSSFPSILIQTLITWDFLTRRRRLVRNFRGSDTTKADKSVSCLHSYTNVFRPKHFVVFTPAMDVLQKYCMKVKDNVV